MAARGERMAPSAAGITVAPRPPADPAVRAAIHAAAMAAIASRQREAH